MAHLEEITYYFLIILVAFGLSVHGGCMRPNFRWHYEAPTLCTHKYGYSCYERYYRDTLKCENLQPEDLTEYQNSTFSYIEIRDSNFKNITEDMFKPYSKLIYLKVQNCSVEYIDPDVFTYLSELEYLGLSNNYLDVVNGEFNGLSNLKILALANNGIKDIEQNSLVELPKLKELYLNDNKIVDMSPLLKTCSELVTLDLSNNFIEYIQLDNCSKLEYLKISNNKLQSISKLIFTNISLVHLDVSNNKLEYIESELYEKFSNLKLLNVSGNALFKVNDMPMDLFQYSRSLETLDLSSTYLKKLQTGIFAPLSNVKSLYLSWNNLTHLPESIFMDSLPRLVHLYINGNNLSYFRLPGYYRLDKLDVRDNNWHCDVLSAIVQTITYAILVPGDVYNTSNIRGIGCQESYNTTDAYTLDKEYLVALQEDQDDILVALMDLNDFLNSTNSYQRLYLQSVLEDLENALFVRDVILYCILLIGIATFLILASYFRNRKCLY